MAKLTREGCSLDYELIDIAAPWVTPRETAPRSSPWQTGGRLSRRAEWLVGRRI
jgi:hypothetical protein